MGLKCSVTTMTTILACNKVKLMLRLVLKERKLRFKVGFNNIGIENWDCNT